MDQKYEETDIKFEETDQQIAIFKVFDNSSKYTIPSALRNIFTIMDLFKGYAKLKQKQKLFQIDNGLRIHERGGAMDKVTYSLNIYYLPSPRIHATYSNLT